MAHTFKAVVAGHLCLDLFPSLAHLAPGQFTETFKPGHLIFVGPPSFSTGGPVSNTGLALHKLGVPTKLIAKVGADPFGKVILQIVSSYDPMLVGGIVTSSESATSYTVIINPPGVDRIFLHCPGSNDTFGLENINFEIVKQAGLFHFGYPPLMRRMYQDNGSELAEIFKRAKTTGVTTSLDMAFPDPNADAGKADWPAILRATLPYVDVFLPSVEELLFMTRRSTYEQLIQASGGEILDLITPELLSDLAKEMMTWGAKIVALKVGNRGLYVRTTRMEALQQMGRSAPEQMDQWADLEVWAPCFKVQVVGTTGSGDATIAGFLSGLLRGLSLVKTVTMAVAVGACNVEAADALSGLRSWEDTLARVDAGWERCVFELESPGWCWDEPTQLWLGPAK